MAIPHNTQKYSEPSFFSPQHFLSYITKTNKLGDMKPPKAVILSYQTSLFDYVKNNHSVTEHSGYFKNNMYYLNETDNSIAIVGRFGIGSPAAAVMMEELIAFGVTKFISVGTAGSLCKDIIPGDLVLCNAALRDEGVSYHYIKEDNYSFPSKNLTELLKASLIEEGLSFTEGSTWTTDAIYRETVCEIVSFREQGIKVVEMEAASLFAVAQYRKIDIASCFSVSDTLAELEWRPEFHSETTTSGLEKIFNASIKALQK